MFEVAVEGAVELDGRYLMIVRGPNVPHAPGALSFPGGIVEATDGPEDLLEATLRREIREEIGVEIEDRVTYVDSSRFETDGGDQVVGVTFLCHYRSGEPSGDPHEVETVRWMTPEEILRDAPPWFKADKLERIENAKLIKGSAPP
jgi:8-oxo-dGTP pyrophosphatase MutT (NUDIX family)